MSRHVQAGPDEAAGPIYSPEAEQAVLGSLLLDNGCIDQLADLQAEHFFVAEYRLIFERMRVMVLGGKVADVLTVAESGVSDVTGLLELQNSVFNARHVGQYAAIVVERSIERDLSRIGKEISASAQGQAPATVKVDAAMAKLTALVQTRRSRDSVSMDDAVVAFLDRLQAEADGNTDIISTGFRDLDELLAGGLRPGELFVLGARPKMGKTTLTLAMARHIARTRGVLFLSQEMPVFELVARHTSALGKVQLRALREPAKMTDDDWGRVSEAVEALRHLRLTQDDQRALTLLDVRRKVMEAKRRLGCDVVVIDFLQLMSGDGDNRNQVLDQISNGLKAMAGEFGVAVVLLSQLSREADKRHGPPVMTDLRDSGAIEAAADVIAMLYREYAHPLGQKSDQFKHYAQLEVIQRNGAPGNVPLWFGGEHQQFGDWGGAIPTRDMGKGRSSSVRNSGMD